MNRKENIRTIKSKKKIKNNFIQMILDEEPITVISLSKKCGLNRNTFYIHYHTIDDVMEEIRKEVVSQIIEKLEQRPFESLVKDPELLGHDVASVLYADTKVSNLIYKSKYRQEFCILISSKLVDYLDKKYQELDNSNPYARSSLCFLTAGLIYALYDSYENDKGLTPDQIISRLGFIARRGVNSFKY